VDGEIAQGTEVIVIDPGGGNVVTVEAIDEIADDIDRELAEEARKREAETSEPDADADTA
jgi:hypothetical protein